MRATRVVTRTSRDRRLGAAAIMVVLGAALVGVAGCSGGGEHAANGGTGGGRAADAPRSDAQAGGSGGSAEKSAPGSASRSATATRLRTQGKAVAYTADLTVRASRVGTAVERAKTLTVEAGGYVADERTSAGSSGPSGETSRLVLKVPVGAYPAFVDRLGRQLGKRLSIEQSAQDKTVALTDVGSRVESAQASLRRLRGIMDRSGSVSDIMEVENAITTRESDLESLQAQVKALERETQYSTVNLTIVGPEAVAAAPPPPMGFRGAVAAGWNALVAIGRGILVVFGALLPFLGVAVVVGVPVWFLARRLRRRTVEHPVAEPARPE